MIFLKWTIVNYSVYIYIYFVVENDVNENVLQSYFSSTYRRARCTPFYCNLRPSRRSRNNTIPPICSTYQRTKKYSSPASLVYLDLCTRSRFWKEISRVIISRKGPSLHFWHGRSGWQTARDKATFTNWSRSIGGMICRGVDEFSFTCNEFWFFYE